MKPHLFQIYRAVVIVLIATCAVSAEAGPSYRVESIGSFGGTTTLGYGINALGQVTGHSDLAGNVATHAFVYTPGQGMQDLGTLGGKYSAGMSINKLGQVTGYSNSGGSNLRAFVYTPGSSMKDIGTLGGAQSLGHGINDSGQVTGASNPAGTGYNHAFVYTPGQGMKDIGTLGGPNSVGASINNSGQVTGYSNPSGSGVDHAFSYTPGTGMLDLGTLGGTYSIGVTINDLGHVAGHSNLPGNSAIHAFVYSPGTGIQDIGTLGGTTSYGCGINASGQVTGRSHFAGSNISRAFIYTPGIGMQDLNALIDPSQGIHLHAACAINDSGQIVAYEMEGNGSSYRAYLLTPIQAGEALLSQTSMALTEGGLAGTYTIVLASAPGANVVVTIVVNAQLSVSPAQITFTSANWNIPQTVTVSAVQDGVAEGNHSSTITHTVNSTDPRYNGIGVSNVTVAIVDAVVPTINLSIPAGTWWTQPDLPISGTAAPNATVTISISNITTGEVRAASAVTGTNGAWSLPMNGLTDGNYELRPEASGVQGSKVSIAIDSHAPLSTLSITSANPLTASGWYSTPVNLAVSAVDGTGGSGVVRSEYTFNSGAWITWPNDGVSLSTEGSHTVCYRSVDRAGNVEAARCVPLAIDSTAPTVNPVFDSTSNLLHLNAQDAVSGIAGIEISRDGGVNWTAQSGPVGFIRDGSHTVHYRVRDNAGNLKTGQTTVTVVTVPNITAPASQTTLEAASSSFNLGAFTDQAGDGPWNVDVDWGDGTSHSSFTLTAPGALGSLMHSYADNGSYSVTLKVTDQAGNAGSRSFAVAVANVAPTATFIATSGPINEGDLATLTIINPSDVSAIDVQAGLRYAFDCGDGNGFGAVSTISTMTCRALDNPNQVVKGRVIDKDGGVTEYSASLAIANVAPVLGAITGPTAPVVRDAPATLTAAFTDAGVRDTHTVTIDWDDGTISSGVVSESNGSGSVSGSHAYGKPGHYRVTMTLTDKDGVSAIGTFTIQVRGGPPAK